MLDVGLDGTVSTFAPVPGHAVLTGMAWGADGDLHVASFGQLPHPAGSGAVVAIDDAGTSRVVVDDVTMAIDVAFDEAGGMFILEYANPPAEPTGVDAYRDGTGRLLYLPRTPSDDSPTVLLDDLNRPTALAINGDDVLISVASGVQARGAGVLVRYSRDELLGGRLLDDLHDEAPIMTASSTPDIPTPDGVHRRRNPLTGEWVLVSAGRDKRPWQGQVEPARRVELPSYDPVAICAPGTSGRAGTESRLRHDVRVHQRLRGTPT